MTVASASVKSPRQITPTTPPPPAPLRTVTDKAVDHYYGAHQVLTHSQLPYLAGLLLKEGEESRQILEFVSCPTPHIRSLARRDAPDQGEYHAVSCTNMTCEACKHNQALLRANRALGEFGACRSSGKRGKVYRAIVTDAKFENWTEALTERGGIIFEQIPCRLGRVIYSSVPLTSRFKDLRASILEQSVELSDAELALALYADWNAVEPDRRNASCSWKEVGPRRRPPEHTCIVVFAPNVSPAQAASLLRQRGARVWGSDERFRFRLPPDYVINELDGYYFTPQFCETWRRFQAQRAQEIAQASSQIAA